MAYRVPVAGRVHRRGFGEVTAEDMSYTGGSEGLGLDLLGLSTGAAPDTADFKPRSMLASTFGGIPIWMWLAAGIGTYLYFGKPHRRRA